MSNEEDPVAAGGPVDDLTELGYRGRGRPKLPEDQRRRQKLIIALSDEEMRTIMHKAADSVGGPKRLQDWVRSILLAEAQK